MRILLLGNQAVEFDAEVVRVVGAKEPVIVIFVGLLPKMSHGKCYNGFSLCCLFNAFAYDMLWDCWIRFLRIRNGFLCCRFSLFARLCSYGLHLLMFMFLMLVL